MGAKAFLSKVFPFLSVAASTFGGPVGVIGASVLSSVLGKDVKPADLEAELTKLSTTEEGRKAAADAEREFALTMQKMGFDHVAEIERLANADRDSARAREIAVKDKMPTILALSTTAVFFGVVVLLLFREPPTVSRDILMILIGVLAAGYKDILGYFFGSSAGSAAARDTLSKIVEAK